MEDRHLGRTTGYHAGEATRKDWWIMGTWGTAIEDNDAAGDWLDGFREEPSLELLAAAVDEVLACDGYLEADEASEAIAACGVIAGLIDRRLGRKLLGDPSDPITATVRRELAGKGLAAVDRILGKDSELRELWAEGEEDAKWLRVIEKLRQALAEVGKS
jgi:hypothetical protein